ncbi:hypothetical protein COO60DRAFT_471834 [Scenedesmus sp. NREL 46B-D3]|nr:hypothetical protein COO60DRAFT_471834 [Scenedesmus sp. NREL 46B-D3]
MEAARNTLFLAAFGLLLVAAESIRETTSVQLASELNVGFELLSSCAQQGVLNYEASELCQGRKPFQLYSTTGCNSYFWCSPDHAACTTPCPSGTVYNHACSCCQDNTAASAAGFDANTCSSFAQEGQPQQHQEAAPTLARRHLQEALPGSSQAVEQGNSESISAESIPSQDHFRARARARARMLRRKRRDAAMLAAAAAAADDSTISSSSSDSAQAVAIDAVIASDSVSSDMLPGGQLFPSKRRSGRRASRGGVWNSYGKRYSSGKFAGKNIVKEPAVRIPSTAEPAAAVVAESAAAAQQPAAAAEAAAAATTADAQQRSAPAASSTTSSSAELRQLLAHTPHAPAVVAAAAAAATPVAAHAAPTHVIAVGGRRDVQMKRVQRFAAQAAAVAAAAGDPAEVAATGDALEHSVHGGERHRFVLNPKLRPMDQKPAAKAIDAEDEQAAPFAAALAAKQQQHHQMQQQVKQHSRAPGQQAMRRVPL